MRPVSEINSALELIEGELETAAGKGAENLQIARDVLAWAMGESGLALQTIWLSAYLLDDPPQIQPTPPGDN